ncbi:response regulator [Pseudomonas sp. xss_2]|uniref:response regulator n=1 Tax=Pseudomonas sp. xss_2 TaxID=3367215 RepID=UPI00370B91B7
MNRLNVLIYQERPSQQITLHQALNAQGVFNVRLAEDLPAAKACLASEPLFDLLILDHAMPETAGKRILNHLCSAHGVRAILIVGEPCASRVDLAREARQRGLWVLAELSWPIAMPGLEQALKRLSGRAPVVAWEGFKTVMLHAHAQ